MNYTDFIAPDDDLVQSLRAPLRTFNEALIGDCGQTPLMVTARDESGRLAGGAYGPVRFGWLLVDLLWVDESHRRRGIGSALLGRLEALARTRGARRSRLATAEMQTGLALYRRHGYAVYAELPFWDAGGGAHTEYLMAKTLT